jgi:flagellar basal body rod protein FlgG
MQSLAVVRTGLEGEQTKMDVISNNLANLNTTGFKKMRPVFADLLYEDQKQAGGFTSQATNYPSGLQQGTGANVVATEPVVTQGSLEQTGNALDLAVNGQGYIFRFCCPQARSPIHVTAVFRSAPKARWSTPRVISCSHRSPFPAMRRV